MRSSITLRWLLSVPVVAALFMASASHAQSPAIDPEAIGLLKSSTAYVAGLKRFRVEATSALELVTVEGQKLQFDQDVAISVQRPDKMRVDRLGQLVKQTFFYDGKRLSMILPTAGFYATVDAPATVDATLDFARDKLGVVAPGADLLTTNSFEVLTNGLTSAIVVGESMVAGVRCDHLAFRNAEVDWQICIQQGDKPLPRKLVITSKKMPQAPEFIVVMTKWDTSPSFTDATFRFTPPKNARKIDWLPPTSAATK